MGRVVRAAPLGAPPGVGGRARLRSGAPARCPAGGGSSRVRPFVAHVCATEGRTPGLRAVPPAKRSTFRGFMQQKVERVGSGRRPGPAATPRRLHAVRPARGSRSPWPPARRHRPRVARRRRSRRLRPVPRPATRTGSPPGPSCPARAASRPRAARRPPRPGRASRAGPSRSRGRRRRPRRPTPRPELGRPDV